MRYYEVLSVVGLVGSTVEEMVSVEHNVRCDMADSGLEACQQVREEIIQWGIEQQEYPQVLMQSVRIKEVA